MKKNNENEVKIEENVEAKPELNKEPEKTENVAKIIPKKKNKLLIAILVVAVILCVVGCLGLSLNLIDTEVVYKKIVTNVVDSTFKTATGTSNGKTKKQVDMHVDCEVDLLDKADEDSPLVKALNDLELFITTKQDGAANKSVIYIETKDKNEQFFDMSMFINHNTLKAYVYSKDLIDKYLELDLTEGEESNEETLTPAEKVSMNKAKSILKSELSKIITEDMCSKKDGSYVLRTTSVKLVENLNVVIEDLSKNSEFLDCYENPEEVSEALLELNGLINKDLVEEYEIEIILDLGIFFNFEEATIKLWNDKEYITIFVSEQVFTYDMKKEGKDNVNVKFEITNTNDTSKIKATVNIAEFGKVEFDMVSKVGKINTLDEMEQKEIKKMDDLSLFEMMAIGENFSNSKLGQLMEEINEYNNKKILDAANQAIDKTNEKMSRDLAALVWADMYLQGFRGSELEEKVKEELEKNDITEEDWDIMVTDTGVKITKKEKKTPNLQDIQDTIDKANEAVALADIAALNSELTLAYVELKSENFRIHTFDDNTKVTVKGKEYKNFKEYYKDKVPGIDSKSSSYAIPNGYEVMFKSNGTAIIEKIVE